MTTYQWNGQQWQPHNTQTYHYDSKGNEIEVRQEEFDGNGIVPFSSSLSEYENGRVIEKKIQRWRRYSWENIDREIWDYSKDSRKVTIEKQTFDEDTWNSLCKETVFSSQNNKTDSIIFYDYSNNNWRPTRKEVVQYNIKGDTLSVLEFYKTDKSWVLAIESEYERNIKGRLNRIVNYNCGMTEKDREISSVIEYSHYDNGNVSAETHKKQYGGKITNDLRYEYEYNLNGTLNEKTYLKWSSGKWNNWITKIVEYDNPDSQLNK